jgi:hypothetical protein
MAANTQPIFTARGDVSTNNGTTMSQPVTAAANDFTGAGANNVLVHTAGPQGSYVGVIRCKAAGTNVASLVRFFLNNGSANTTAANNSFIGELALPITTASATAVTGPEIDYILPRVALPPGFRIYAGLATAVSAGWIFTPIAGQYDPA